jgi:hypothetical protein
MGSWCRVYDSGLYTFAARIVSATTRRLAAAALDEEDPHVPLRTLPPDGIWVRSACLSVLGVKV